MDNKNAAPSLEQQVSADWKLNNTSGRAINADATKLRLSDEMREAVADVVNDTIRNALKPGGLLWNNRGR
ncbi:hypothetical protein [Enterobacter asburiae]|uniref:hypothetical protein n=1 Tax=Enterobacter asburiae TaxID=61645 RepID=UPI00227825FE|nr:hypothetical protein [Enterobacter asburiae]MCY1145906.1 hypothetical protein [Enterobacter asburiae]